MTNDAIINDIPEVLDFLASDLDIAGLIAASRLSLHDDIEGHIHWARTYHSLARLILSTTGRELRPGPVALTVADPQPCPHVTRIDLIAAKLSGQGLNDLLDHIKACAFHS